MSPRLLEICCSANTTFAFCKERWFKAAVVEGMKKRSTAAKVS